MVDKLRSLGGTPEELLVEHDFIDYLLPMLRADFHLCGTYPAEAALAREPLDCPLDVFMGRDDPATANQDDVAHWRETTCGACHFHRFDGAHFYLDTEPQRVLARIGQALSAALDQRDTAVPAARSEAPLHHLKR